MISILIILWNDGVRIYWCHAFVCIVLKGTGVLVKTVVIPERLGNRRMKDLMDLSPHWLLIFVVCYNWFNQAGCHISVQWGKKAQCELIVVIMWCWHQVTCFFSVKVNIAHLAKMQLLRFFFLLAIVNLVGNGGHEYHELEVIHRHKNKLLYRLQQV